MVKKSIIMVVLLSALSADSYIYEHNCLSCHKQLSFDLETIYFKYLLKYSDEISVKSALIDFLKAPNADTSVMPKEYINSFGLKQKTTLNPRELKEAVDFYWDKYTVFGKLK